MAFEPNPISGFSEGFNVKLDEVPNYKRIESYGLDTGGMHEIGKSTAAEAEETLKANGFRDGYWIHFRRAEPLLDEIVKGEWNFSTPWTAYSVFKSNRIVIHFSSEIDEVYFRLKMP